MVLSWIVDSLTGAQARGNEAASTVVVPPPQPYAENFLALLLISAYITVRSVESMKSSSVLSLINDQVIELHYKVVAMTCALD